MMRSNVDFPEPDLPITQQFHFHTIQNLHLRALIILADHLFLNDLSGRLLARTC